MNLQQLKPREKMMVAVIACVIAFSVYMKAVYQPLAKQTSALKTKIKRSESQLNELTSQYPSVDKQQEKIRGLTEECEALIKEISEIEKKLPSKKDTSQLIGEFTRLASEAKLISIRQKTVAKDGYNRIYIEIKLVANYLSAINYISRLETISDFIRIDEVTIDETKGGKYEDGGPPVRIVVSWILGDTSIEQVLKAKEVVKTVEGARDILASKVKPLEAMDEKDIKLEGITYNSDSPTAIINGEVFKVDSEVKGFKVKKILPDSVVLSDGIEDHVIKLR